LSLGSFLVHFSFSNEWFNFDQSPENMQKRLVFRWFLVCGIDSVGIVATIALTVSANAPYRSRARRFKAAAKA
jgi:hypothetical protein